MSKARHLFLVTAALGGCIQPLDSESTSSGTSAIEVAFDHAPGGIDCIAFTFANEDGTVTDAQRSLNPNNIVVGNLAAGAYSLTALAYASGAPQPTSDADCGAVPLDAPWGTEEPLTVVLQQGTRTRVVLRLVPVGTVVVHPDFVETPRVIAQGQGAVGQIAADHGYAVWMVGGHGPTGKIVALDDVPGAMPTLLAANQTNPSQVAIDPASHAVYWTNTISGARDSNGHRINDGSVWTWNGTAATQLTSGGSPSDLQVASANGAAYWGELSTDSIECSSCATSLATNQLGPNTLAAHGDRVFWGNGDSGEVLGMAITDPTPTSLHANAPRTAYGMTADDDFLYYVDADPAIGFDHSAITKIPVDGGPAVTLLPDLEAAFPIAAAGGYVYFGTGTTIGRIPAAGGTREDLVSGVLGGFAVTTDSGGHTILYWTDSTHGGLVWRGRLD